MEKDSVIAVFGHKGMVGSSIVRSLKNQGFSNIITDNLSPRRDLTSQNATLDFFSTYRPDYVFLAAAKVGGIYANSTYPAQFIYNNLAIQNNVIESSRIFNVKKLLFMGSSCIYPKEASQPLKEEYLLSGTLEPTNEYYAIAKIAGIKMCEAYRKEYGCQFISCQPTNLYGPNDNYDLLNSHVLPALLRKFHEAKINNTTEVVIWGTGSALREFLHVDDLAEACVFLMENYNESSLINVGSGEEISIKDLSFLIKKIVGYQGNIIYDISKPDGTPRKLLDCNKIHSLGWRHKINLQDGIEEVYKIYKQTL